MLSYSHNLFIVSLKALTKSTQLYNLERDGGRCEPSETVFAFVASEPERRKPFFGK